MSAGVAAAARISCVVRANDAGAAQSPTARRRCESTTACSDAGTNVPANVRSNVRDSSECATIAPFVQTRRKSHYDRHQSCRR